MSARVFNFNPLVMSEMRRMLGRSSSDGSGTASAVARVRRDLFGPVNREDAQAFVEKELAALKDRETERWGFDFEAEKPLEQPRFRWERVSPQDNIPEAYAMRRLLGQSESGQKSKKDASTNTTTSSQEATTTTRPVKTTHKQSQITDYMRCRKRSLSVGDLSSRKGSNISSGDVPSSPRRIPVSCAAKRSRK